MSSGTIQKTAGNGAISKAQPVANGKLQGAESDDFVLPRIHIYQGLPAEAKQYGKGFEAGDLINTLTGDKVEAKKFVPIRGSKQWIHWREPRGSGMYYAVTSKKEVPTEDLEWNENTPPAAQEYINWVVIFEGEDMPMVLSFTKTSLVAGKTINTLEAIRAKGGKGSGLYALEMKEKSNDKGTWVAPQIRPAGDPTEELVATAESWFSTLDGQEIPTPADNVEGSFNPDAE